MIGEPQPLLLCASTGPATSFPYVDRLVYELVPDRELIVLKVIAGEVDMQGRWIQFKDFPVMKENEEKGNYRVFQVWAQAGLIQAALKFNQTWDGPEREYLDQQGFPHRSLPCHQQGRDQRYPILRPRFGT